MKKMSKMSLPRKCPACHMDMNYALSYPFSDFDGSIFRLMGDVYECLHCGFVRVDSGITDEMLAKHYSCDCLYSKLSGCGVGGDTPEDVTRYKYYMDLFRKYGLSTDSLVDIGCSRGGFLKYLVRNGVSASGLLGIDIDPGSLSSLERFGIATQISDAKVLPFADGSRKMLAYSNVLEHILELDPLLSEASRVLASGGHCLIDVPDARNYRADSVGPGFWSGMKEHFNHFTSKALEIALARHRLEVIGAHSCCMPMKAGNSTSSLIVIARKRDHEVTVDSSNSSDTGIICAYYYRQVQEIQDQINRIDSFCARVDRITFWGVALEFFNLSAFGVLEDRQHAALIDSLPAKIGRSVSGIRIQAPADVQPKGKLVVCSYLSQQSILKDAMDLGWVPDHILVI